MVELLLQAGARGLTNKVLKYDSSDIKHYPKHTLQYGYTALSVARDGGHTNIVSLLEQYQE